MQNSLTKECIF